MRYLGLGIGHTVVGGAASSADDANEEEVELAGTGPSDAQHDDWGNQGEVQEDQTFQQDIMMDGDEDEDEEAANLDEEAANLDEDEDEDEEIDELEEEGDGDHSDTDLGYDDL